MPAQCTQPLFQHCAPLQMAVSPKRRHGFWRRAACLSLFPALDLVHLSFCLLGIFNRVCCRWGKNCFLLKMQLVGGRGRRAEHPRMRLEPGVARQLLRAARAASPPAPHPERREPGHPPLPSAFRCSPPLLPLLSAALHSLRSSPLLSAPSAPLRSLRSLRSSPLSASPLRSLRSLRTLCSLPSPLLPSTPLSSSPLLSAPSSPSAPSAPSSPLHSLRCQVYIPFPLPGRCPGMYSCQGCCAARVFL